MKYVTLALIIFIVGYAVTHRPAKTRTANDDRPQHSSNRAYRNRSLESLKEELGAREQMLREIKQTMATGNVPKCASATSVTFTDEAYATVRRLENELEVLKAEIRSRAQ